MRPLTSARGRAAAAWGPIEASGLAAGWGFAAVVLAPAATGPGRGAAVLALVAALAFWPLVVVILRSDLLHFVIPDEASAAVAALGLATAAGTARLSGSAGPEVLDAVRDAAACGAGGFALFWAVGAGFRAARRDALGHGDVKLAGALATWLSPGDAALALEIAALGAVAALLATRAAGRRDAAITDVAVPFGAFMAPAAWLVLVAAPGLRHAGWMPW